MGNIMQKRIRFTKNFKIRKTDNSEYVVAEGEDIFLEEIKFIISENGVQHPSIILTRWSQDELNNIGIQTIIDNGYDTARYNLTGTPVDVQDSSTKIYNRTYPKNILTEKANYLDTVKTNKIAELNSSYYNATANSYNSTRKINNVQKDLNIKCNIDAINKKLNYIQNYSQLVDNSGAKKINIYNYDLSGDINSYLIDVPTNQIIDLYKDALQYAVKIEQARVSYLNQIHSCTTIAQVNAITFSWT
jgi:hypothetical protein